MIKIRKHLPKDIPYRVLWLNDHKVNKFTGDEAWEETTLRKEKKWFEEYKKTDNKRFFTICDDTKPIGFMGLSKISKKSKNAELFIAIGDSEYRGKGIGKKAMQWIIDYGFNKLKLHKIYLNVYENNIPAVKLYKSLGFVVEGKIKDDVYFRKEYHNTLYMGLFNSKNGKNDR
ncbi:MAG: GNAT family protein [Patescibacteria group bacterium]|jgi:RimJ/RimL family protein N-acetyltransferase